MSVLHMIKSNKEIANLHIRQCHDIPKFLDVLYMTYMYDRADQRSRESSGTPTARQRLKKVRRFKLRPGGWN